MATVSIEDVQKLVRMQLGKRQVNVNDRFVEDLGAESADVANIVARVEEVYGITIKEAEIARLFTPTDLFALIRQRTQ